MSRYPAAARTEKGDVHPPLGRILEQRPKEADAANFFFLFSTGADAESERESFHLASVERKAASTKREREARGARQPLLHLFPGGGRNNVTADVSVGSARRSGKRWEFSTTYMCAGPRRARARGPTTPAAALHAHKGGGGGGERSARTTAADVERESAGAGRFPAVLFRDQREKAKIKRALG